MTREALAARMREAIRLALFKHDELSEITMTTAERIADVSALAAADVALGAGSGDGKEAFEALLDEFQHACRQIEASTGTWKYDREALHDARKDILAAWQASRSRRDEYTEAADLRRLLWMAHPGVGKYGDDRQMQCGACLIDFKRDSVELMQQRIEDGIARAARAKESHE